MSLAANTSEPASESSVGDYFTLLKPGVMSLVVFSGATGMWLAPLAVHPFLQCIIVLCIAAGSGAGGAMNMWYDRDIDAKMQRTQKRPVPAGRIASANALTLGGMLALFSVMTLGLASNWVAAGMLAFAIFFYAVIYTMWLKRSTPQNIVIGGAAGAFPPVIGWLAASPEMALMPWILFAIIFLWTPPHFWALALYRNADYQKASVPMMPVVKGLAHTKKQMLGYTLVLFICTLLPCFIGFSGAAYGFGATALGGLFVRHAWRVLGSESDVEAKKMFGYSILYLFALFAILLIDYVART